MSTFTKSLLVLPIALSFSSLSFANDCMPLGEVQEQNIQLAINSSKSNFNDKSADKIHNFISEKRYVQHSPGGKDGAQGLVGFIKYMQNKMPTFHVENVRAFAEGDIVLTQSVDSLEGKPFEVSYDWYRVNDGKITEHWDVVAEFKEGIAPESYTSGPGVNLKSCLDKEKIRSIALDYFYTTWDNMDASAAQKYLGENFVQHNPSAKAEGKSDKKALVDLVTHLGSQGYEVQIDISKVIVTGDFAAIHAKWTDSSETLAVTDILRFDENYKIVEHWDGLSAIPANNANPRDAVF
ncbi:nuclear transport factor 2 family protein [Vibrio sp. D173a]|uniref:nuclear transport factor 2 family protein n=1 Tax=Vibrio sp. D173a TaxID=2836349 RepID=UPI00255617D2|nr:nuclear transport factor 2 family protein [Vibrio sp. D173a]MDK9756865.1 nuclear transport factor 2 family protein [Vibrio sp. D173a]